jgi:acylphosphatase
LKRIRITVTGRVQGVSYRHSARIMARYLKIRGFVRNMSDGSVYIEAEGEAEALGNFVLWCRKGPDFARVEKIETQEIPLRNDSEFNVRM